MSSPVINAFYFHPSQSTLVLVVKGMAPKSNLTRTDCLSGYQNLPGAAKPINSTSTSFHSYLLVGF